MAINIEIGANKQAVITAQDTANEAIGVANGARSLAQTVQGVADNALSVAQGITLDSLGGVTRDAMDNEFDRQLSAYAKVAKLEELTSDIIATKTANLISEDELKATRDNLMDHIDNDVAAALQQKIDAAKAIADAAYTSEEANAALSNLQNEIARVEREITSGSGISDDQINDIINRAERGVISSEDFKTIQRNLTNVTTTVDNFGNTYVTVERANTDYLNKIDAESNYATKTSVDEMNTSLGNRITEISEKGIDETVVNDAIRNYIANNTEIATNASVQDNIRMGVSRATDSIIQEVGNMIEGAMENTADDINFDSLAVPVVEDENSTNQSFNELTAKLQEKPVRRADVLKKVIDENAYYWYVMPVIDQRIYRDTVVVDPNDPSKKVVVEYGWQKAIKERYWYHKQDADIRDHYIYLFRSDINSIVMNATEQNTSANQRPMIMPINGNPKRLKNANEIPTGLAVFGKSKTLPNNRKINKTVETDIIRNFSSTLTEMPISPVITAKPGKTIPGKISELVKPIDPTIVKINSSKQPLDASPHLKPAYISPNIWAKIAENAQYAKDLANGNYPSDFYYVAAYAEVDDSSMYKYQWFSLNTNGGADKLLSKRDDGSYYYEEEKTTESGSGVETVQVTVQPSQRARFYVDADNHALYKLGDSNINYSLLIRRPFADVSRDIKVHMLPVYLLGSTGIAIDTDDIDNDGKFNYITIDSMLTPACPENDSPSDPAPKANIIEEKDGVITIGTSKHKSKGVREDGRYTYICRDNIALAESGLPCVYGQGYTWLPLDAKGDADDNDGLGVTCDYTQDSMWIANGLYSHYNGLIPSGYTKETLKNLTTMYKYKIVEKFVCGQWDKNEDTTVTSTPKWINNKYVVGDDGRIITTQEQYDEPVMIPIFLEDYSDDNIADLNEDIFNVNIEDDYLTYTIKDGMILQNAGDGATVSNYLYDTLSYLTEKGSINTNNVFLVCVEDDGDEYIFDEYIWEKGKVLKLNEQKRVKYSEDLRKVEYVQRNIGHTKEDDSQPYGGIYTGEIIEGNTKDEQASNILKYLTKEELVETGATIKNPEYIPAKIGRATYLCASSGYYSKPSKVEIPNSDTSDYVSQLYKGGVMPQLTAALKELTYLYREHDDTGTLIDKINYVFSGQVAIDVEAIKGYLNDGEFNSVITGLSHNDRVYKKYYEHFLENIQKISEYTPPRFDETIIGMYYSYVSEKMNNIKYRDTKNEWIEYFYDALIISYITTNKSTTDHRNKIITDLFNRIKEFVNREQSIGRVESEYPTLCSIEQSEGQEYFGVLFNFPVPKTFKFEFDYTESIPAQGVEFIPVKNIVFTPIRTTGGDNLQKYNKILAFLIGREPVGDSNGFEWTYSLWRYMPSSNQYANVGTVSTISVSMPDLNSPDTSSEVGQANSTDVVSQVSNAVNMVRQDIISRYDNYMTEAGIMSLLPSLRSIIEQNFMTTTVEEEGQTLTKYILKNVVTHDDLSLAVQRQTTMENNMAILVDSMNNGVRAQYQNGSITKTNFAIATSSQPQPGTDDTITIQAPDTLEIPETTGSSIKVAALTTLNKYSVSGGAATKRIIL